MPVVLERKISVLQKEEDIEPQLEYKIVPERNIVTNVRTHSINLQDEEADTILVFSNRSSSRNRPFNSRTLSQEKEEDSNPHQSLSPRPFTEFETMYESNRVPLDEEG